MAAWSRCAAPVTTSAESHGVGAAGPLDPVAPSALSAPAVSFGAGRGSRSVADVTATPWAGVSTMLAKGMVGSSQCRASPTSRSVPSMRSICIQSTKPSEGPLMTLSRSACHPETGPAARSSSPRMAPSSRARSVLSSSSARSSRTDFSRDASCRRGVPRRARDCASGVAAAATSGAAGCRCACRS